MILQSLISQFTRGAFLVAALALVPIATSASESLQLPSTSASSSQMKQKVARYCSSSVEGVCRPAGQPESIELTLGSAIHRALTLNRALRIKDDDRAKSRIEVAEERAEFEFQLEPGVELGFVTGGTAGTGPSVAADLDFSKKFSNGTKISIKPEANRAAKQYWYANLVTEIRQPLLRGYGRLYNLDGLQRKAYDLRKAQREFYKKQVCLVVDTVKELYEIAKQRRSLEILSESRDLLLGFHHAAYVKERLGIHDAIGVNRAELEVRKVEDAIAGARKKLGDAEDRLRELLVLPLHADLCIAIPLTPEMVSLDCEEAVQTGLCHRVELDGARDEVWEYVRRSKVKKQELLPQLDLVLNYSRCGQNQIFTKACWGDNESEFGVGIQASTKINRHRDRLEVDKSLVDVHSARLRYSQESDEVAVDVRRRLRVLERAAERMELAWGNVDTSERDLNLANAKYMRNLITNRDVVDAAKDLRGASLDHLEALVDHIVGEYELLKSLGILLEKPCI